MSKTFDLSALNLSAGTHEITVKARASGYADSPASNAVSYTVATPETPTEYTVSGTWYFNETLQMPTNGINQAVNFKGYLDKGYILENADCKCMIVGRLTSNSQATEFYKAVDFNGTTSDGVTRSQLVYSEKDGWKNEAYRTITFDGTQTVSKEFYEWFTANAVFAFTIDGTRYHAKEGMNWGEWVESEYNTGGFFAGATFIFVYKNNQKYWVYGEDLEKTININGSYVTEKFSGAEPT